MLTRALEDQVRANRQRYAVVLIAGPRQSGKTTLARATCPDLEYVNFESPIERAEFREDPAGFFDRYPDGAVLDEVQHVPEVLSFIQVRVDEDRRRGRWVLTGSQQLELKRGAGQSLAGRVALMELLPLSIAELEPSHARPKTLDQAVLRGGYPALYDESVEHEPEDWLENYVKTFVQRDVRAALDIQNEAAFDRFLRLCAARTGQLLNQSELGRDCQVDQKTVIQWIHVLEGCFLLRLVRPYHRNFGKRLVKSPKLHFLDTGLACRLMRISTLQQLSIHPLRGNLVESWCYAEVLKHLRGTGPADDPLHWRSSDGVEVDLVLERGSSLVPIEIKAGRTPSTEQARGITKLQQLNERDGEVTVERGLAIYGGDERRTGSKVDFVPWDKIGEALDSANGGR